MKAKKTKLPEKLYHYTDLMVSDDSCNWETALTPSNLKYDNATLHDEPLFLMAENWL